MPTTKKQIKEWGFKKTSIRIVVKHGEVRYEGIENGDDISGVYLMVLPREETLDVVYVGKAGGGIHKRFREHLSGYRRNPQKAGIKKLMQKAGRGGAVFDVWFRPSGTAISPFGGKITAYQFSLEEEFLLLQFRDEIINRQIPQAPPFCQSAKQPKRFKMKFNLDRLISESGSAEELKKIWEDSYKLWDDTTLRNVDDVLFLLGKVIDGLSVKIVKSYSGSFPIPHTPVVAFAELGAAGKIRSSTRRLCLTLDGQDLVVTDGKNEIAFVGKVADYLSLP